MVKIGLLIGLLFLTACNITEDFDREERPEDFSVTEVAIEELVQTHPDMSERQKEIQESETAKPQVGSLGAEDDMWYVSTSELNVRSSPSAEGEVLGKVFMGDKIKELGNEEDGQWIKFDFEGTEGFVSAEYLSRQMTAKPIAQYRSVVYSVNVRTEPSEDGDIIGELGYFQVFDVHEIINAEDTNTWLKITNPETSEIGYVLSNYCVELD